MAPIIEQRKTAANRKRRIIYNNDGCDIFVNDGIAKAENFLALRTTALLNTHVDSIFYCPIHSGFSRVTYNTKVGELFINATKEHPNNLAEDFIKQGTDTLKIMVDFARDHDLEVFASMRMNDTHDGWGGPHEDFLLPQLKRDHPEWLLGTHEQKPEFGMWSAVNYAIDEIRDLAFRLIEEQVTQYDVDGIDLDFLRHDTFFPSTARGDSCTDEEREMMTDLMRRVRKMADQHGESRGKPVLVSIRVNNAISLNYDLGMDVERWLNEGLVDLVSSTHYYRMTPWSQMAELCAKSDVPFYPCLAESRVQEDVSDKPTSLRNSIESYRARAMNGYRAGGAGIQIYNMFDPTNAVFREVGDPDALQTKNKIYFTSVRGMGGAHWRVPNAHKYWEVSVLSPQPVLRTTITLNSNRTDVPIEISDDLSQASTLPRVTLRLQVLDCDNAKHVHAWFNDEELSGGQFEDNFLSFDLPPSHLRVGENVLSLSLYPAIESSPVLEDVQVHLTYDEN